MNQLILRAGKSLYATFYYVDSGACRSVGQLRENMPETAQEIKLQVRVYEGNRRGETDNSEQLKK